GLVGKPSLHHSTRERVSIFLNGRWIQSNAIARAIVNGYDTLLPPRRFPVAVVHLTMDPRSVDVNVHPAKAEVRFGDDGAVFRTVLRAVRQGLLGAHLVGGMPLAAAVPRPAAGPGAPRRGPPTEEERPHTPGAHAPMAAAPRETPAPAGAHVSELARHARDQGGTAEERPGGDGGPARAPAHVVARRQRRQITV